MAGSEWFTTRSTKGTRGILFGNRKEGQRGQQSATIALTPDGLAGTPSFDGRRDARFAAVDANYGRSAGNGKFARFGDVGPGVLGRVGVWHSHRFCDAARGFRADARTAASGPPEDTARSGANLVRISAKTRSNGGPISFERARLQSCHKDNKINRAFRH